MFEVISVSQDPFKIRQKSTLGARRCCVAKLVYDVTGKVVRMYIRTGLHKKLMLRIRHCRISSDQECMVICKWMQNHQIEQ